LSTINLKYEYDQKKKIENIKFNIFI
jgi:hypothetical protein